MTETKLGKIQRFDIGMGGYDEAMFGLTVTLGGPGWGVGDFDGTWAHEPDAHCKWTRHDQMELWANMCVRVRNLMQKAKVQTCADMVGIPIEARFENNRLVSWRVLEEVL